MWFRRGREPLSCGNLEEKEEERRGARHNLENLRFKFYSGLRNSRIQVRIFRFKFQT